ncbi:DUF3293 domain-containing protein [Salinisphaera sp.]|uniref:DUF3293 domain-containing protein n=1 Tax=Salinisphaera sp. TaxID=1914330 RepID=UPI000C64058E|nr:DUF3293 domain-containing protein [Salinisphaera sp.]MBS63074.1 hypothetical protein [Salinisphaera sp.]
MSDDLRAAFEATNYRVFLDGDSHVLRIGAPCPPAVADWLSQRACARRAWLITAYNPNAEQTDDASNHARDALLRDWADRRATAWLETVNEDPHGDWPDEPGVLIAGVEEGEARAMAHRLGQAALVQVAMNEPTALVWLL